MTTKIVGMIGGIGSGKSTVAQLFAEKGAVVVDADRMAHDALGDPQIKAILERTFGTSILDESGEVVRSRLAQLVFQPDQEVSLQKLEQIIHPWVTNAINAQIEQAKRNNRELVILDIPLLLDSPHREQCDVFVFIRTSDHLRQQRVRSRGWSPDELERREARQTPLAEKERVANFHLDNNGDRQQLALQVDQIIEQLNP